MPTQKKDPVSRLVQRIVRFAASGKGEQRTAAQLLTLVNQLAAVTGRTGGQGNDASEVITAIVQVLTQLVTRRANTQDFVMAVMADLNTFAAGIASPQPALSLRVGRSRRETRDGAGVSYYLREGTGGDELTESRVDQSKQFRVTNDDYDKAIEALVQGGMTMAPFTTLNKKFIQLGGTNVRSAYHLRVVLRFLRWLQPPLVKGARSGYRINHMTADEFRAKAREAWSSLPREDQ